jgi:lysozyme family protein
MAANNFEACLAHTLKYEGGYVDHPADPGGATNWGITIGTLRAWRQKSYGGGTVTKADVRALTKEEAARIYRANYWNAVGGDGLPYGVDLCAFDEGVNSGPARGKARYRAALVKFSAPVDIIRAMCAGRRAFFQSLRTFKVFGRGWMNRAAQVEAAALKMAFQAQGMLPSAVSKKMRDEAATAGQKAKTKAGQAKAAGGGAVVAGPGTTQAAGWSWEGIAFGVMVFAVIAFIAFVAIQAARTQRERQNAFMEIANV